MAFGLMAIVGVLARGRTHTLDLPLALAAVIASGALVMSGLMTSPMAFLCAGMGAAAYWIGHFSAENYLPIMNRGDAAALYAFVFLYIAAKGTGIWGVSKD